MSSDHRENLCNNLIYFRKKNKLTQLQLAEKLGYSNKNISKWEKGEIVPDIFMLNKLALIYGITIDEFINGEKEDIDAKLAEEIVKNNKMKKKDHLSILSYLLLPCCDCVRYYLNDYIFIAGNQRIRLVGLSLRGRDMFFKPIYLLQVHR